MKLRNRLLLIIAVPLVAIVAVMTYKTSEKIGERTIRASYLDQFDRATDISAVIHELQKERGFSAGFVGSKGAAFRSLLEQQRRDTDAVIVASRDALAARNGVGDAMLDGLAQDLDAILAMRRDIDDLAKTVPELARFYTGAIRKGIGAVEANISTISDAEIGPVAMAFLNVVEAKEASGLERAMGAVGFGSGAFAPKIYERYLSLVAAQTTLLGSAANVSDEPTAGFVGAALASAELGALTAKRGEAKAMVWDGAEAKTDGPAWFKTSTAWVDRLKRAEDEISSRATDVASERMAAAEQVLIATLVAGVLIASSVLAIALLIGRKLSRQLAERMALLADIAENRTDMEIDAGDGADEMSELSRLAVVFRDGAIARNAADAEAQAATRKANDALKQVEAAHEAEAQSREEARRAAETQAEREAEQTQRQRELEDAARKAETERAEADRQAAEEETKRIAARQAAEAEKALELAHVVATLDEGLKRLADGDLSQELNEPFVEEYEGLRETFNGTLRKLAQLVGEVTSGSASLAQSAVELKSASMDLAQRTERQAATLEMSAGTAREAAGLVEATAKSVEETTRSASDARERADQSAEVVREATTAMDRIATSSKEISKIIAVIDDIAFQTNLLALNAGVEAARAGEAGRGFAVVATEVRGLAERASSSAKEINALITESERDVDNGVSLVKRTGEALDAIKEDVGRISSRMEMLNESSHKQTATISSLSGSIAELDAATQNNAAMAEEMTAAAVNLSDETNRVAECAAVFDQNEHSDGSAIAA